MRIKCRKKRTAPLEPEQIKTDRVIAVQVDAKTFLEEMLDDSDTSSVKETLLTIKSIKDHLRYHPR